MNKILLAAICFFSFTAHAENISGTSLDLDLGTATIFGNGTQVMIKNASITDTTSDTTRNYDITFSVSADSSSELEFKRIDSIERVLPVTVDPTSFGLGIYKDSEGNIFELTGNSTAYILTGVYYANTEIISNVTMQFDNKSAEHWTIASGQSSAQDELELRNGDGYFGMFSGTTDFPSIWDRLSSYTVLIASAFSNNNLKIDIYGPSNIHVTNTLEKIADTRAEWESQ